MMKFVPKVDLSNDELLTIAMLLISYPHTLLFGSRVKGTSKRFSDLDICLKDSITDYDYELLKEAFEESDLPFTVDIVEYDQLSDSFKKIIDREGIEFGCIIADRGIKI